VAAPSPAQDAPRRDGTAGAGAAKKSRSPRPFATATTPRQAERVRTFDVRHIKGELTLDTRAAEVRGTVTHTLEPLHGGMTAVALDCARELKVARAAVGQGSRAGDRPFERKGDTLVVTLDRPYAAGEAFDLAVTYSGSPGKGIYFIPPDPSEPDRPYCVWTQGEAEETRHWLPCYDFPNDRATSEMVVTVPKPLSVLSNGRLVGTKENADGTRTFHWTMETPHVSYLISLVATEFNVVRDRLGDLPVDYYVLKNVAEADARRRLGKTPAMVGFFEERTGHKYPYAKYAQAVVPEFTQGGMENISATTLNDLVFDESFASADPLVESVVAHELAHQWFGDLITCRDWSHIWLNEGFASYFDPLWFEHDRGDDAFRLRMDEVRQSYLAGDASVRRALVEARYTDTDDLFDGVTYAKGACVLHALRGLVGDDAWWRGIRGYVAKCTETVVETDDFRRAMEAASGRDLGWFFDQWVYHAGHPELKASWRYEPDDRTVRLKVEQTQAVDDLTPLFRLPTTVEVDDGWGVRSVPVVIDGRSHEFAVPCPSKPKMVRIDPKGWLIKELEFEKPAEEWAYQLGHAADAAGRLEAAEAVAKRKGDATAIEALTRAWRREREPGARVAMLRLLAGQGETSQAALVEAAGDRDLRVRSAAFNALAGRKADPALEALFRAAWSDPKEDLGIRRAALRGLSGWKVKDRDDLIASALKNPSGRHALAGEALGMVLEAKGARAREAAVLYSRAGQPTPLRRRAVAALAQLARDDPPLQAALLDLVGDPSRPVRTQVWRALQGGNVKGALEALEAQLKKETHARSRPVLEGALAALKASAPKPPAGSARAPAPSRTPAPADHSAEVADLERRAAERDLEARELRNKAEALKLQDERARLKPAPAGPKP
jgi:aminopeptidase N